jgi:hypothetical protein
MAQAIAEILGKPLALGQEIPAPRTAGATRVVAREVDVGGMAAKPVIVT